MEKTEKPRSGEGDIKKPNELKEIREKIESGRLVWKQYRPFQGMAFVMLRPRRNLERYYPAFEDGDILVAKVEPWHKVTVVRPELLPLCPFSHFEDGFYTHAPAWRIYKNKGATPIPVGRVESDE